MTETPFSDQKINASQLTGVKTKLSQDELDSLWFLFSLIETAWQLDTIADRLRSRWEDMITARCRDIETAEKNSKAPVLEPYTAEYVNAATVIGELRTAYDDDAIIEKVFFETIVKDVEDVMTRLDHMKFFVVNDFIKLLVLSGGFRQFGQGKLEKANYRGFMKGSRFAVRPSVRMGD